MTGRRDIVRREFLRRGAAAALAMPLAIKASALPSPLEAGALKLVFGLGIFPLPELGRSHIGALYFVVRYCHSCDGCINRHDWMDGT